MHLTIVDSRSLGLILYQPVGDLYWAWATDAWTTPFAQAAHVRPFTPLEPSPSPMSWAQTADIGTAWIGTDCVFLLCQVTPMFTLVPPGSVSLALGPPGTYGWPT
jgi:hypothetical protein